MVSLKFKSFSLYIYLTWKTKLKYISHYILFNTHFVITYILFIILILQVFYFSQYLHINLNILEFLKSAIFIMYHLVVCKNLYFQNLIASGSLKINATPKKIIKINLNLNAKKARPFLTH